MKIVKKTSVSYFFKILKLSICGFSESVAEV